MKIVWIAVLAQTVCTLGPIGVIWTVISSHLISSHLISSHTVCTARIDSHLFPNVFSVLCADAPRTLWRINDAIAFSARVQKLNKGTNKEEKQCLLGVCECVCVCVSVCVCECEGLMESVIWKM